MSSDRSGDETRAMVTVIDALYLAVRTNPQMLLELEKLARRIQKKHIGWSILVPERSEVIRMMMKYAVRELAKRHPERYRATRIAAELIVVGGHHLAYLGIPYAPSSLKRASLHERVTEEIRASLEKKEDAEDIVVAFFVAYGVPRSKARGFVQSARRRGRD